MFKAISLLNAPFSTSWQALPLVPVQNPTNENLLVLQLTAPPTTEKGNHDVGRPPAQELQLPILLRLSCLPPLTEVPRTYS